MLEAIKNIKNSFPYDKKEFLKSEILVDRRKNEIKSESKEEKDRIKQEEKKEEKNEIKQEEKKDGK